MSRICEEFHCLPSQAIRELENCPGSLPLDILDLRSYQRTYDALRNAKSEDDVPKTPMVEAVWEVQQELFMRSQRENE